MKFTGRLRMLNSQPSVAKKLGLLQSMVEQGFAPSEDELTQLAMWLEAFVNTDTGQIKEAAPALETLIPAMKSSLKALCPTAEKGNDGVGYFLVEALRCTNFQYHSSVKIETFLKLLEKLGFVIIGSPKECVTNATFKTLTYDSSAKQVVMNI